MLRKPVDNLYLSSAGLKLIKNFEGFVAYPYDDLVVRNGRYPEWTGGPLKGTLTIGYGHTNLSGVDPKITVGMRMTESEASALLLKVLSSVYEKEVRKLVKVPLAQYEYDALVSFCYNCGAGNLSKSTLLKKVNAGLYDEVPAEFMKWTRSKGQVLTGLVRRRRAEAEMWRGLAGKEPEVNLTPKEVTPPVTKTDVGFWGWILSLLSATAAGATESATSLQPFSEVHPYVKYAFLSMIVLGASAGIWSKIDKWRKGD